MIETETLDDALADVNGHGTHVAGTVGSSTYGVAKNTTLIAVKILSNAGWGSAAQIAGGVYWAVAHDSKGKKKVIK
jgi:subtilisin family serine protease